MSVLQGYFVWHHFVPSTLTDISISSWNDWVIPKWREQPKCLKIVHKISLFTVWKALARSTKTWNRPCYCSYEFSLNFHAAKTIYSIHLLDRKAHWYSGVIVSTLSRDRKIVTKILPMTEVMLHHDNVHKAPLYLCYHDRISPVLWNSTSITGV